MLTALKAKLALVVHTKVGATILAATLVAGGGSAVAAVATHGNLGNLGPTLAAVTGGGHDTANGKSADNPADDESVEGKLTAYTAPNGSTAGSITVQPDKGSAATFAVNASTRINGYHSESSPQSGAQQSTSSQNSYQHTEGTPGTGYHAEGTPGADDKGSGGATGSLSDLQTAVTMKYRVQVQATKSNGSWVAMKVTVEGPGIDQSGSDDNGGQGDGQQGTGQTQQAVVGKIKSVDASASTPSFVVTTLKGDVTVDVNGSTRFEGDGHPGSVNDLKAGMYVAAQGTKQSDGSVLASDIFVGWSGTPTAGDSHEPTPSVSPQSGQ